MPLIEVDAVAIQLTRKSVKNLNIRVTAPEGRVLVSAPWGVSDAAVRAALAAKIPWIKQQQRRLACQPRSPVPPPLTMTTGERHWLWGQEYGLDVVARPGRHRVEVNSGALHLYVRPGTDPDNRARVLESFYREQMAERIRIGLDLWQPRMGVSASAVGIRKMKTLWGSCNTRSRRISLNLELAKRPPESLEYVLVHELVHLFERRHNDRFYALMGTFLPDWRERRARLNSPPR